MPEGIRCLLLYVNKPLNSELFSVGLLALQKHVGKDTKDQSASDVGDGDLTEGE